MGEYDDTIGWVLLAVVFNTYMFGVNMSQFWRYWIARFPDPPWIRLLVAALFVLNGSQAAAVVYMAWMYMVENFNNPEVAKLALWPYPFTAMGTAVLALTNQTFQLYRIYRFTGNRWLCVVLLLGGLAGCGTGLAAAAGAWIAHTLAKLRALKPIVTANLAIQAALDVVIAGVLSRTLTRSKTHLGRTDRVLDRLIRTAIQSGTFTAVFALGTLFSFRFATGTQMLGIFALPIGRIYTHTMLDLLLERETLRSLLERGAAPAEGHLVTIPVFAHTGSGSGSARTGHSARRDTIVLGATHDSASSAGGIGTDTGTGTWSLRHQDSRAKVGGGADKDAVTVAL